MKNILSSFLAVTLILVVGFSPSTAHASNHVPMLTVLVMDASGSISDRDFEVQKAATIAFIVASHEISKNYPGRRSDWVAVSFFGDANLYTGTPFINVNNQADVVAVCRYIMGYQHPRSGTAIYTAIAKATAELEIKYRSLPGNYIRNIILTTDGMDIHSPQRDKDWVRRNFVHPQINLFMVGVGRDANLREYQGIADGTTSIDNYAELAAALHAVRHLLEQSAAGRRAG